MSLNWMPSVDMLADAGIVDFDASAYVVGAPSRFVGSPQYPVYNLPPLNIAPLPKDEYQSTLADKSVVKNPFWKKALFAMLAVGTAFWGIKKLGSVPGGIKNLGGKVTDFFKNLFKKKP